MKKLVFAMGLAGLLAGPALAADTDFSKVDTDGSGEVSMDEAIAAGWEWTDEQFQAADKDGSGGLSEEEFNEAVSM